MQHSSDGAHAVCPTMTYNSYSLVVSTGQCLLRVCDRLATRSLLCQSSAGLPESYEEPTAHYPVSSAHATHCPRCPVPTQPTAHCPRCPVPTAHWRRCPVPTGCRRLLGQILAAQSPTRPPPPTKYLHTARLVSYTQIDRLTTISDHM